MSLARVPLAKSVIAKTIFGRLMTVITLTAELEKRKKHADIEKLQVLIGRYRGLRG